MWRILTLHITYRYLITIDLMSICLKIPWYSWIHLNILGSKKVEYIPLLKSFHWYSDRIWSFFFVCWSSLSFSVRLLGEANPVAAWGFSLPLYFTTRWVYKIRIFTAVYLNRITYQSFIFNLENHTVMKALLFAVWAFTFCCPICFSAAL